MRAALFFALLVLLTGCGGSVSTDEPPEECMPQERGAAALDCERGIVHPECGLVPDTTTCYRTGSDIGCCPPDLPKGGAAVDTAPDAEQGGAAGAASMPTPEDRACVAGEQGSVTSPGLSLTGYGCTEVINRSGIPGARSWCCPVGAFDGGAP